MSQIGNSRDILNFFIIIFVINIKLMDEELLLMGEQKKVVP